MSAAIKRTFRAPGEVTNFDAKCAELLVATHGADLANALFAELGHGRRPAKLVLALLVELGPLAAGVAALLHGVPDDTLRKSYE